MEEGSSTNRPPMLKNDNYSYWKNLMRSYLKHETYVWYVVEKGPIIPMKDGQEGNKIPKGILAVNTQEPHLFSMDNRAKNTISCSLDVNEYNRVSACKTTQEIWRLLEVTHQGINQVKETKINMLIQQYEAFKMKENGSINEMYSRFTLIIKWTEAIGESDYSDESDKEMSENNDVAQLCFMAKDDHSNEVCLKVMVDPNKWILDSGCSRHMTSDCSLFTHIIPKDGGLVTFGDNSNGKIIGKGKIGTGSISFDNVSLVDGLKFNLITISQLIDSGHKVHFEGDHCMIRHASNGGTLVGKRDGNIYTLLFDRKSEMSMMGELTFFLGSQIKQSNEGIFINQSKYTRELLKRFGMDNAKPRCTPISPNVNLVKDENGKDVSWHDW
ncbi:hypothetical protein RJ640_003670 [Escallonia rubra]|uniref:Retrovirus-related Pol polyprotein from transposon TNT 1-94-like beta-barrel domain-containing protein n=1 Tax=Escallonia rubra TaxID=112253 RepID=A0AA88QTP9_9ASTE|nr:hypothetical protein RJ640_003670 [Escallonia rubra]